MVVRILLAALCIVLPVAGEKSQSQKEWVLGAGAMLAQLDGDRLDVLPERPSESASNPAWSRRASRIS
jgi:hypothetical protein